MKAKLQYLKGIYGYEAMQFDEEQRKGLIAEDAIVILQGLDVLRVVQIDKKMGFKFSLEYSTRWQKWSVNVMQKKFRHHRLRMAIQEAIEYIHKAEVASNQ